MFIYILIDSRLVIYGFNLKSSKTTTKPVVIRGANSKRWRNANGRVCRDFRPPVEYWMVRDEVHTHYGVNLFVFIYHCFLRDTIVKEYCVHMWVPESGIRVLHLQLTQRMSYLRILALKHRIVSLYRMKLIFNKTMYLAL